MFNNSPKCEKFEIMDYFWTAVMVGVHQKLTFLIINMFLHARKWGSSLVLLFPVQYNDEEGVQSEMFL